MTEPYYLDVTIPAGGEFNVPVGADHNTFVYVFVGEAVVGPERKPAKTHHMVLFQNTEERDNIAVSNFSEEETRFILVSGKPIGEPVARAGPFVMNTEEELRQAFRDYRSGNF